MQCLRFQMWLLSFGSHLRVSRFVSRQKTMVIPVCRCQGDMLITYANLIELLWLNKVFYSFLFFSIVKWDTRWSFHGAIKHDTQGCCRWIFVDSVMGQVEGIRGWLVEVSIWDPFCVTRRKVSCHDFDIIIKLISLLKTTFRDRKRRKAWGRDSPRGELRSLNRSLTTKRPVSWRLWRWLKFCTTSLSSGARINLALGGSSSPKFLHS